MTIRWFFTIIFLAFVIYSNWVYMHFEDYLPQGTHYDKNWKPIKKHSAQVNE